MGVRHRTAGLLAGTALVTGALLAAAGPAGAYSPNPTGRVQYRDTDTCPCSLSDPFDGTYFEQDAGGSAVKIELIDSAGRYLGKVEFHPYDEKLWVYDTLNDGDGFSTNITYWSGGTAHDLGTYSPAGTDAVMDYTVKDFDIPEGASVDIQVYDDAGRTDYVAGARGTGSATA
ncbi:hypothetical protein SRB5_45910 [Streptomyces sp. RB5]|uniref:Secreted protein n=1 Tax=Streptomyces smaragdinus TaxID=2585196 RepID=A0A7K0CNT7_9ACTN|nr:hypothetical protein [Streptomyces smaragdinus]MQY14424.1 hypothetical protein [Streptomyces smaragdinus]